MITAQELRQKYFQFFQAKGHKLIPSASLIPENDPTVLFTTAGMHPLVPYLLGESHPEGKRLVNAQKCIRTQDIDEVGDTTHHTFFEMLGNWSLGDYFKREAIEWSWEFLTDPAWLGLDKSRLACSVFAGDADASFDAEAFAIWKKLGIDEKRIAKLPKKNNWWGPAGITGPCGPDSEMFYWVGEALTAPEGFNDDNARWVEIWNDVFMQYNKEENGTFSPLLQKNVDTGMGLERMLAALNGLADNYLTDVWTGLIGKIEELSGKKYGESPELTRSMRIIADHLKAATFIIGDEKGVTPANTGAGYIVRRLLRRAIRYGRQLKISADNWAVSLAETVINDYFDAYPALKKNSGYILKEIQAEQEKFQKTLQDGLKKAEEVLGKKIPLAAETYFKIMQNADKKEIFREVYQNKETDKNGFSKSGIEVSTKEIIAATISGEEAFYLYQTFGFPIEMIIEMAQERNLFVDVEDFHREAEKHQDLSRTAAAGMFKGGLADASEETKKLHTAAHLLLAALRKVLGDHIYQRGSNITPERLRFDFSHPVKMTPEQIAEVERLVNEAIQKDLPIVCEEKPLAEAKAEGAMGVFESKYGEKVKVYKMGEVSHEICGGPHADHTGELGHFKIIKEESSSSGVRRIKAILE